ncbi:MAG: VCBS repeat-containing protein [Salegentibacter sp.]
MLKKNNSNYFGDKDGRFQKTLVFSQKRKTYSIKVSDLNNDGYLDIVEGNSEDNNYVFLGNNNSEFKEIKLRKDLKEDTYHIEIGDLNNDGLPDIIESNSGAWNLYYRTIVK